jgi:putative aminopeptidase FrvX
VLHISLRAQFATDLLSGKRYKNKRQLTAINGAINGCIGNQPIHIAAQNGHAEICQMLIDMKVGTRGTRIVGARRQ